MLFGLLFFFVFVAVAAVVFQYVVAHLVAIVGTVVVVAGIVWTITFIGEHWDWLFPPHHEG